MPTKPGRAFNPQNPGTPIDPRALQAQSRAQAQATAQQQEAQGIARGSLGGPLAPPDPNLVSQLPPQAAEAPEPALPRSPQIPESFRAGTPTTEKTKHPVLQKLELDLGLVRIEARDADIGGHRWTFRPMSFLDYEWMAGALYETTAGETPLPSLTVCSVASCLAAIDGVPCYEVFDVETKGRHVPDPLNPPPDIRRKAADAVVHWFREQLGMWELISRLDEAMDIAFESQRQEAYPLWAELASPARQRMLAMRQELAQQQEAEYQAAVNEDQAQTRSSMGPPTSLPGGEPLLTPESSPQTPEPTNSGLTAVPPASTSTGANG